MTATVNLGPEPMYQDVSQLPLILAQKRITNIRRKQLVKAASRGFDDPPPPPKPDECCGSSCDPCVKTLWKEELECWRQRWGENAQEDGSKQKNTKTSLSPPSNGVPEAQTSTMPGGFDW